MNADVRHSEGVMPEEEILFSTPFGYFFPDVADSANCLLDPSQATLNALERLGDAMGDPGPGQPVNREPNDSDTPSIFTYFGQFIDHDLTARTDRDGSLTDIGEGMSPDPIPPAEVVAGLRNGRRPTLDLDSVFGDGPTLVNGVDSYSQPLYDDDLKLHVFDQGGRRDLPRERTTDPRGRTVLRARIADMRNDENVMISQLHAAFLIFYNAIYDTQALVGSERRYIRARRLASWCYQLAVVEDYLKTVCDAGVVEDVLFNGPRFVGASVGRAGTFMPLEFSVAAFRFGHSMIRPQYELNAHEPAISIADLLGTGGNLNNFPAANAGDPHPDQLRLERMVDWTRFVEGPGLANRARKIDPLIANGLFDLTFEGRRFDPILRHLAKSNLIRGYNLSIPTGQAACRAFGIRPMTPVQVAGEGELALQLESSGMDARTPLWFYILREAAVQQDGERLGAVGSRLVAESVINLLKQDPNSYLNNVHHPAIRTGNQGNVTSIELHGGFLVSSLADILRFAGVL